MKKLALVCGLSAVLGTFAALAMYHAWPEAVAWAQTPRPRVDPLLGRLTTSIRPPLAESQFTPDELVNINVYDNANRSVVNINTRTTSDALLIFELTSEGAGSGAVLDKQGHVLTNHHVVAGAKQIKVMLFDGQAYEGRLIGGDELNDLAVVKIDAPAESLYPVTIGDSTHLRVGQRVFAIGNPFGLERTLTTGIVSSLNRTLPARGKRTMKGIIQIDAAINPGNSGGPLLDSHSRLIGINTAIASATGQNTGVGFAVPANTISRVVPQLLEHGKVIRPDPGISRVFQTDKGLLVATLVPGGPAERAGVRGPRIVREKRRKGPFVYEDAQVDLAAADLIVAVDGTPLTTADEFLSLIEGHKPGEETILTVIRDGQETQVRIRLAAGE